MTSVVQNKGNLKVCIWYKCFQKIKTIKCKQWEIIRLRSNFLNHCALIKFDYAWIDFVLHLFCAPATMNISSVDQAFLQLVSELIDAFGWYTAPSTVFHWNGHLTLILIVHKNKLSLLPKHCRGKCLWALMREITTLIAYSFFPCINNWNCYINNMASLLYISTSHILRSISLEQYALYITEIQMGLHFVLSCGDQTIFFSSSFTKLLSSQLFSSLER
jgi:hypothetical protein